MNISRRAPVKTMRVRRVPISSCFNIPPHWTEAEGPEFSQFPLPSPPQAHELPPAALVSLVSSRGTPSPVGICQIAPDQQYDRA